MLTLLVQGSVRTGSFASLCRSADPFRSSPNSGHSVSGPPLPKSARNRLNAPIRSRRRSSIRRLDKLSNIVKHCREQQLKMENPRAERPIRGADAGNASFRPRNRDSGRTHRHAREGEGTRIYHHRAPRGVGAVLLPRRQAAAGRLRHRHLRQDRRRGNRELKLAKIAVQYTLGTASTRIPLLANGTIDLECGNTTNNAERQQQVWYTNTHFLTASRFVSKVESKIGSISDLKGKTIVSPAGSTNIKQALEFNSRLNLGMRIIPAQDQAEAFLMVETGRAVAFVQGDIVLAGLIANAKDPKAYVISEDAFSKPEPYGIMLRKDDTPFKAIADAATATLYESPEGAALYAKWFTQPIPPKGINLNIPMSPAMRKAFEKPTDSPDPSTY